MAWGVHKEERGRWPYEVRWEGGMTIARCARLSHAEKIVSALNKDRDLGAPLSAEELRALDRAIGSGQED